MNPDQDRAPRSVADLQPPFRIAIVVCLVATLCYLAARLSGVLVLRPPMIWPLWPGCALLVAFLLLVPRKIWPILIPAGLAGFVLYDLQIGLTIGSITVLILADTIEVLVAALGVSYAFDGVPRLNSVKALAKYSLLAVILAPASAAFVGAAAQGGHYWSSWRISFFTEALAFLTVTPAILNWLGRLTAWTRKSRAHYFEAALLMAGLFFSSYITFVGSGSSNEPVRLYSLVPFLLWSALRFGSTGISTSMIVVAFLSIGGAVEGRGPFAGPAPINNVLHLQLFLFVTAIPFMLLAALIEERKRAEAVLRESEQRFRLVANTAPVLIWMSGLDRLRNYFNQAWLDFTGRPLEAELGTGWAQGVHPDDIEKCLETYTQAFDRRRPFRMEYRLRGQDGNFRWILDVGVLRVDPDGSFAGYIGSCLDLTERKQAEQALRQSEQLKASILGSLRNHVVVLDSKGRVLATNKQEVQFAPRSCFFEKTESECIVSDSCGLQRISQGKNYFEVWGRGRPADDSVVAAAVRGIRTVCEGKRDHFELEYCCGLQSDTDQCWLLMSVTPLKGGAPGAVVSHQDITGQRRHEQAIRELSGRLINAQEQERSRIARELHDDINQRVAVLAIELQQLESFFPQDSREARQMVHALWNKTHSLSTEIQHLSHQLHSAKLEHLGLIAALRGLCTEFSEQHRIASDFQFEKIPPTLGSDVSLSLFRVAQESLHNVAKHSRAKKVRVDLIGGNDRLLLRVSDDGVGFAPDSLSHQTGLGMISMSERIRLVGGTLSVWSRPSMGAQVEAAIPLSRSSAALDETSQSDFPHRKAG